MAQLSTDALEFARTHISTFGDSDFFPKRAEFAALWFSWPNVVDYLSNEDLEQLAVYSPLLAVAPRPDGTFRIVHQLDPLNALAYTALGMMVADDVENNRTVPGERVACSYRIDLDPARGNFFSQGNGFAPFIEQSRALATANNWVLLTDISDFYNQISLHRLQNSLETAGPAAAVLADDVEDFLTRLNSKVSQGIPVGPACSSVLAEAVLTDIDQFIANRGVQHTRYVDDFRIFGNSRDELEELLQALTLYLYGSHRLYLSPAKTWLGETADFIRDRLDNPDELELQLLHGELQEIDSHYDHIQPDAEGDEEPEDADDNEVDADDPAVRIARLVDLMAAVCNMDQLDLGLARHVLRTCRRYRVRAIVPMLFDHFDFFAPVLNDVVLYLKAVSDPMFLMWNAERLYEICTESETSKLRFGRIWLAEMLVRTEHLLNESRFKRWVYDSGIEPAAASAAIYCSDIAWVRNRRAQIDELGPWDRRDLIRASVVLPLDERRPWLEALRRNQPPHLERWVISWAIGQP